MEKQSWEEKFNLAAQENQGLKEKFQLVAQENENLKREGTAQIQKLTNQVTQLTRMNTEMESVTRERQSVIETLQKDNEQYQNKLKQLDEQRSRILQDNERLGQQQGQQVAIFQNFEQQIKELKDTCQAEQRRADSLDNELNTWKQKLREQEQSTAELESVLENERRERGQQAGNMNQVMSEAHRLQGQLNATKQDYEEKLQTQQELIKTLEASRRETMEQLQSASDRYGELLRESTQQHEAESAAAMRQLEENFLLEKNRLGEQMGQEIIQLTQQNAALQAEIKGLKELSERKSDEINRLMASHQEIELHGRSGRPEDAEAIQHLQEELEKAINDNEELFKELGDKEELHQEDLRVQAEEFEAQYNDFVKQVEEQFGEATNESGNLRAQLDELTTEYKQVVHNAELLSIAKEDDAAKWTAEREQLRSKIEVSDRQLAALHREVDHRRQELELKETENRALREQVDSYLSPNNETTKQVELLQRERLRLEEQNLELRRQFESMQTEMDAKIEEANEYHLRAVEQESTHRQTIRSLYTEKEEMSRNMMSLATEKATMELQLSAATREKNELMEASKRLDKEKRSLEAKLQDLMKEATERLQSQEQNATLNNQDAKAQLNKLSAELRQRDEQMSRGQQQLRELQATIQTLETRNRQLERELETANAWTVRLKSDVETLHSEKRALENVQLSDKNSNVFEHQRALDDLSAMYERYKSELMSRVHEEEDKVHQLQAQLNVEDEQHHAQVTDLLNQLQAAQNSLDELQERCHDLERENQSLNNDISTQRNILEEAKHLEIQYNELHHIHEQLKIDMAGLNADSATTIAELEEHTANLQVTLEREQQAAQQLRNQNHAGNSQFSDNAKTLRALRDQVREFELMNEQLRRQIQTSEQKQTAKEQSVLHEKLQKERETRSLQARCETLESQIATLRRELVEMKQQNEEWERILNERGGESEGARRNAAVQTSSSVNQMQREFQTQRRKLELQIDELTRARDAITVEKHQLESELNKADEELDALRKGNEERARELSSKDAEINRLNQTVGGHIQELEQKEAEVESFRRDTDELIHQLEKKDEIIETLHQVNQNQLDKLDDKDSELTALNRANSDHMQQLAAKDEELSALRHEHRKRLVELDRKEGELENLKLDNDEQFTKLQSIEQRGARRSERSGDYDRVESALQGKLTSLQRKYDQVVKREEDLVKEVAALKAEKLEMKTTIKRELRKLNLADDVGSTSLDARSKDTIVRRELLHVFELAQSYQAKQLRQDALIQSKEVLIADLSAQVKDLRTSLKTFESEIKAKQQHYELDVSELDKEVVQMSQEVSRLKLENRRLREKNVVATNAGLSSKPADDEWERKYAKLKVRVRELLEENSRIKDRQLSKGEVKRLVDEIDALSSLVKIKDAEIDELRSKTSRSNQNHTSSASTTPTGSSGSGHRVKELMQLVQQKEKKIMVLNDHMTELMTQAVKLQYENECYVVQYGDLGERAKRATTASSNPARVS